MLNVIQRCIKTFTYFLQRREKTITLNMQPHVTREQNSVGGLDFMVLK